MFEDDRPGSSTGIGARAPANSQANSTLGEWLRLNAALAFRPEQAGALLARCGDDPRRALEALAAKGTHVPSRAFAESVRARLSSLGVLALPWVSPAYPETLRRLPDAPPLLFVRGQPAALLGAAVAIVGSRAATAYGLDVARVLAGAAARAGAVVVSGLALGVDAAAHRGALEVGGTSVAVQARGLDGVYPARHRSLAARLCERGCLVGELPLGTPPRAPNFPMRNRLIAGLASAVLVVEARERSGSLVTAKLALDRGIDVLAVPGPITAATSCGTNRLIQDGATPVLCERDLVEALGLSEAPKLEPAPADAEPRPEPEQTGLTEALVALLRHEPLGEAELRSRIHAAALPSAAADGALERGALELALFELQLEGRIGQERDGRWRLLGSRLS